MHLVKTWSRMMHIMMGTWEMGNMKHTHKPYIHESKTVLQLRVTCTVESTRARGPCFSSPAYVTQY